MVWADRLLLEAIENGGHATPDIWKLCRHIAVAEQVWFTRLAGRSSLRIKLWEEAEGAAVRGLFADSERLVAEFLDGLTEDRLDEEVAYTNQSGQPFRTTVRDILTQVTLHGQYHRGQINRALREAGGTPAGIDFITFARLG